LGEVLDETGRSAESSSALEHSTALRRQLIKTIPETPENTTTLATRYEELGTSLGRSALYKEAQAAYEKAIQLGTTSGQAGEFTHSRSTSNLAITLQKQGRLGGASRLYRQAVEQFELLVKREPTVPLYRERLAESLLNLGQSLAVNSREVEPLFRRAAAGFDRLASESIGVAENRRNLAISLLNLATICSNAGRLREALMLAVLANDLLEDLVEKTPTFVRNRELRAKSVVRLARLRGQLGEIMTARSGANHGRDLFAELKPKGPDLLWEEACNLGYLAQLEETLQKFEEADRLWRQTIDKFEAVVKEAPARIDYRGDMGAHILRLALSSERLGRNAEAERQFKRSVEILEHIIDEEPERASDRLRLAQAAGYLGHFLHKIERYDEADGFIRLTYTSYERLFFEGYQQEAMVRGCADAMANIAVLSLRKGRLAESNNYYLHALKLFDSLPPKLALDPTIREARANALDNLGACLKRLGKFNEAEPRIRQARKIRETLVADFPDRADHREALGLSCAHLGEILAKKGQPAEARTLLEQAVALCERALKDDPRNAEAKPHLRGSLKALASLLLEQNLPAEAAAVTRRLLDYTDPAGRIELLTEVGSNLVECARLAASESKEASSDREATALSYATEALGAFKQATAESKRSGSTMIKLAWFRLLSPVAHLRDPVEALALMREAAGRSPRDPLCSAMLGVALYHNGELKPALAEFQKSRQLDPAKFGVWDFYAAMTHWRLGQKSEARTCFDRAEHWMDANPTTATYKRIRASASALLELPNSAKTVHSVAKPAAP
jgi:tetratricopeptide (TPR) repeat protein